MLFKSDSEICRKKCFIKDAVASFGIFYIIAVGGFMTGTGVNIAVFQRGKDICNVP